MGARENVLRRVREALQRAGESSVETELLQARTYIGQHQQSPRIPSDWPDLVARFQEQTLMMSSTLDEVSAIQDVPAAIAKYLANIQAPRKLVCWNELASLDWAGQSIEVEARAARDGDVSGVTGCFCAIAETGTLMLASGPATPGKTSLLPDNHIALVPRTRVVRGMEEAWALARSELGVLPRAVSFISGPSRTADIEQTLVLGAHGPYRVHVILMP